MLIPRFLLASAAMLVVAASAHASPKTLGQIRSELAGQDVVVLGSRSVAAEPVLSEWLRAAESADGRRLDPAARAPYALKGRVARVVEIRPSRFDTEPRPLQPSGEPLPDDDLVNPLLEIFARAGDTLIGASTRYANLVGARPMLELASVVARDRALATQSVSRLRGATLYAVGYSALFPPDADITAIGEANRLRDVPSLTPLQVVDASYVEREHAVLLKVEFDGRRAVALAPVRRARMGEEVVDRLASSFLTRLPVGLTHRELAAIRAGEVFPGMSLRAIHYAWGYPDEVRSWRLVYAGRADLWMFDNRAVFINRKP